jgi:hypothetical protein
MNAYSAMCGIFLKEKFEKKIEREALHILGAIGKDNLFGV